MFRRAVAIGFVMWAICYLFLAFILDLALPLNAAPFGRLAFGAGMLALPGLWCALLVRKRWYFIVLAGAIAAVFLLAAVPWTPRKLFVRDLMSVEEGMTIDEAEAVMDGWGYGYGADYAQPPEDWPTDAVRATFTGRLDYRWTEVPTADWGHIHIVDGHVTEVDWSRD